MRQPDLIAMTEDEDNYKRSDAICVASLSAPWPPRVLWPNSRAHWAVLARAKREYRMACAWLAKSAGVQRMDKGGGDALHVRLLFVPPTRRVFDLDNALAAMKSGLDGVADVCGVDDSRWTLAIAKAARGEVGGVVKVCLSAG